MRRQDRVLGSRGHINAVLADRDELRALAVLIDQLGWRLDSVPGTETITGDSRLIVEIAHSLLADAASHLCEQLSAAGRRPDRIVIGVRPAMRHLSSAFAFFRQSYRADGY